MKTSRISIVLSLVLLSSTVFAKQYRFYNEGVKFGKELCKESSYGRLSSGDFPAVKEIVRAFVLCEPSSYRFRNAFSDFKTVCKGIKQSASQSYSKRAFIVQVVANMVIDSDNIGQVFIKIGNKIKLLANMPMQTQIPRNLKVVSNPRSKAYVHGKAVSTTMCNLIVADALSRSYQGKRKAFREKMMGVIPYFSNSNGLIGNASALVNMLNGCKEGLKRFPLNKELKGFRPLGAILIRFMHSLFLNVVALPDTVLKGGKPNINVFAQTFIKCGKELEAIC